MGVIQRLDRLMSGIRAFAKNRESAAALSKGPPGGKIPEGLPGDPLRNAGGNRGNLYRLAGAGEKRKSDQDRKEGRTRRKGVEAYVPDPPHRSAGRAGVLRSGDPAPDRQASPDPGPVRVPGTAASGRPEIRFRSRRTRGCRPGSRRRGSGKNSLRQAALSLRCQALVSASEDRETDGFCH